MASQITGISIVCSTICSGAQQRNHPSPASLAFVREIGDRWIPSKKGQYRGKCFHIIASGYCLTVFLARPLPEPIPTYSQGNPLNNWW